MIVEQKNLYEKWYPKSPPKTHSLNFVGVASGYLNGKTTTLTTQLYACSLEEAMRMFGETLAKAGLVNLSEYHVTRKD